MSQSEKTILQDVSDVVGDLNGEFADDIIMCIEAEMSTLEAIGAPRGNALMTYTEWAGQRHQSMKKDLRMAVRLYTRLHFDTPTNGKIIDMLTASLDKIHERIFSKV